MIVSTLWFEEVVDHGTTGGFPISIIKQRDQEKAQGLGRFPIMAVSTLIDSIPIGRLHTP